MSIHRITRGDFETFSVIAHPTRTYSSSSTAGVTGSVNVFARRSTIEKEMAQLPAFLETTRDDADLDSMLNLTQRFGKYIANAPLTPSIHSQFVSMMNAYMEKVNAQGASARKQKLLDIIRFTPSFSFTSNTLRKLVVKDQLNSYYRTSYPSAHWAYTNYNCLSFFTSPTFPTGSALLYPNVPGGPHHEGYVEGVYSLSGAFSFDFHINPRYTTELPDGTFHAGTIMHLSSSYALSLVSGSVKDENGRPKGFRLKLQLSHSADVSPSISNPGSYPNNLCFLSDDNSLLFNNWHHVIVRWGTDLINDGTGSFNIDGVDRGTFVVPSGTVAPLMFDQPPSVLSIGNYYEGFDDMKQFFAHDPATRDGLEELDDTQGVEEPISYHFRHPLNADLHDIAIKRHYMSDSAITHSASVGPTSLDHETAFYLPPFFVAEAPFRRFIGAHGGILQTPFFEIDGTTNDPFNVALSFGVGGHYINIENFLKDFASNVYPRAHLLTGSAIPHTTDFKSANEFLYEDPLVRKRNLLITPCDDGLFVPSFELLASESITNRFVDDLNCEELSFINLDDMLSTSSLIFGTSFDGPDEDDNALVNASIGFTPEQPGLSPGPAFAGYTDRVNKAIAADVFDPGIQEGAPLTIYQRTRDASSNQVTFFDVSNLFYGKRILPGSLTITDVAMTGSGGTLGITLKDDGMGNIYRADCFTSASTWNSVGNCYYSEGIILIKSPHLYFFGKEQYEISFKGEQGIHVLRLDAIAPANQLNSSSNPNYQRVNATGNENDPDNEFVYITQLNFHDNNLNVIAKAQLAQPITKANGNRLGFRVKFDF